MTPPQDLDLDRLHHAVDVIVNGGFRYRHIGKTTAYLYLMLGELQTHVYGWPWRMNYTYFSYSKEEAKDVAASFADVVLREMKAEGIDNRCIFGARGVHIAGGPSFWFNGVVEYKSALHNSIISRAFVDLDDRQRNQLKSIGIYDDFMEEIVTHLDVGGDII